MHTIKSHKNKISAKSKDLYLRIRKTCTKGREIQHPPENPTTKMAGFSPPYQIHFSESLETCI